MRNGFGRWLSSELIYGGHILSLGGASIAFMALLILDKPISFLPVFIPYVSSQVVYTYDHLREDGDGSGANPERSRHLKEGRTSWLFALYLTGLVVSLSYTNLPTLILVACIVGGGILYTGYAKGLSSRLFAGFKTLYVSLFWAASVFFVPLYLRESVSLAYGCLFAFVLLRFIVSTTFFDLKDIEDDARKGLRTIPVILGRPSTERFLYAVNLLSALPLLIGIAAGILPLGAWGLLLSLAYDFWYIRKSRSLSGSGLRMLSYLAVDGEMVLWLALAAIGRMVSGTL